MDDIIGSIILAELHDARQDHVIEQRIRRGRRTGANERFRRAGAIHVHHQIAEKFLGTFRVFDVEEDVSEFLALVGRQINHQQLYDEAAVLVGQQKMARRGVQLCDAKENGAAGFVEGLGENGIRLGETRGEEVPSHGWSLSQCVS